LTSLTELGFRSEHESALAALADPGLRPARVSGEQRGLYQVVEPAGERPAELAGRLRHRAASRLDLPRRSAVVRKLKGTTTEPQVLAANVDVAVLVWALDRGFRPRPVERLLAAAWESGARPLLVLSKADQHPDPASARAEAVGVAPGVAVVAVSALAGDGLDDLARHLGTGLTLVLIGASGAGKSTLLNRLAGAEVEATGAVRPGDRRGRHTTTSRQLHRLPGGLLVIDTPGLRELGLWGGGDGVEEVFEDIRRLGRDCRFRDCRHQDEPGCAVLAARDDGRLDPSRLDGWRKLGRELAHMERRRDVQAMLAEKRRWKRIHMAMRRRDRSG
jgi:ribosome biogenesis GTPase